MPALLYRAFYFSHGISGLRRNVFRFVGFSPVRSTMFGMVENVSKRTRARWQERMRKKGARAR
jgi:putative NADPH-quinone reductase